MASMICMKLKLGFQINLRQSTVGHLYDARRVLHSGLYNERFLHGTGHTWFEYGVTELFANQCLCLLHKHERRVLC